MTMDTVRAMEVIETTLTRRGRGVEGSPIRVITQYWDKDGTLLAERDPSPDKPQRDPEIDDLRRRVLRLVQAIEWATGAVGDFGANKPADAKPYWWRKELRERAGL